MAWTSTTPIQWSHYYEQTSIPAFVSTPYSVVGADSGLLPGIQTAGTAYVFENARGVYVVETVTAVSVATLTTVGSVFSEVVSLLALHTAGPFTLSTDDNGYVLRKYDWVATNRLHVLSTIGVAATLTGGTVAVVTSSPKTPDTSSAIESSTSVNVPGPAPASSIHKHLAVEVAVPVAIVVTLMLIGIGVLLWLLRRRTNKRPNAARGDDEPTFSALKTQPEPMSQPMPAKLSPVPEYYKTSSALQTPGQNYFIEACDTSPSGTVHELSDGASTVLKPGRRTPTPRAPGYGYLASDRQPPPPRSLSMTPDNGRCATPTVRKVSSEEPRQEASGRSPVSPDD